MEQKMDNFIRCSPISLCTYKLIIRRENFESYETKVVLWSGST